MKKRTILLVLVSAMQLCLTMTSVHAVVHYPSELSYYDKAKAYTGITFFTPLTWPIDTSTMELTGGPAYTYMIDMYGRLVHKWPCRQYAPLQAQLLENGNILRAVLPPFPADLPAAPKLTLLGGGQAGRLEEVDWNGKVVWSLDAFGSAMVKVNGSDYTQWFRQRLDMQRIYNKKLKAYTTIFIALEHHTGPEAQALGARPNPPGAQGSYPAGTWNNWSPSAIYEMDMNKNLVWKWSFFEHFTQSYDSTKMNYVSDVRIAPGKMDINLSNTQTTGKVMSDWNQVSSLDYNPDLGYIVFSSRNHNEIYVIHHDKTFVNTAGNWQANIDEAAGTNGDFLYRFGAPMNYNNSSSDFPGFGSGGTVQMWGAFGINWIKPRFYSGGPEISRGNGAGNLIIFDNHACNNNTLDGGSHVLEIDPTVMSRSQTTTSGWNTIGYKVDYTRSTDGSYVWPHNAGTASAYYGLNSARQGIGLAVGKRSNQVVWDYWAPHPSSLSSSHFGSAQRLPNGNTFICSGETGHFMEVNKTGIGIGNSIDTPGRLVWEYINPITNGVALKYVHDPSIANANQVFRAYRWDTGHPGIKNRVRVYSDGRILPRTLGVRGVGYTLTGRVPCNDVPCYVPPSTPSHEGGGGGGGPSGSFIY